MILCIVTDLSTYIDLYLNKQTCLHVLSASLMIFQDMADLCSHQINIIELMSTLYFINKILDLQPSHSLFPAVLCCLLPLVLLGLLPWLIRNVYRCTILVISRCNKGCCLGFIYLNYTDWFACRLCHTNRIM